MRNLLSLVVIAALLQTADVAALVAQSYETYCLPESLLFLGRVELGAWGSDVRQLLGKPLRQVQDSAADDGGTYSLVHLQYKDLLVDLGRDKVELLETSSPKVSLPSGIRVGTSIGEVGGRLGLVNPAQYLRGDTLEPINCEGERHDPNLSGLQLIFGQAPRDSTRRVRKIRLVESGP